MIKQMPQPADKAGDDEPKNPAKQSAKRPTAKKAESKPDDPASEPADATAGDQPSVQSGGQPSDQPDDLTKADLPDAQSLSDALRQWKDGDDPAVVRAQQQGPGSSSGSGSSAADSAASDEPVSPWAGAVAKESATKPASAKGKEAKPSTAPSASDKPKAAASGKKTAASGKKVSRNQARRFARQRAVQAIYQWDHGHVDVGDVLAQFDEFQNLSNVDLDHFQRLFRGVALKVSEVDALLEPALDRPVTELDPVERSILRMAAVELRDCLQTPARVVINEAVELAKRFGADQGHKYVNGVIDKVAFALRETEMKAGRKS